MQVPNRPRPRRAWHVAIAAALTIAACSGDDSGTLPESTEPAATTSTVSTAAPTTTAPRSTTAPNITVPPTSTLAPLAPADAATAQAVDAAVAAGAPGCDPLDTRTCLLPYPSNAYTSADRSSATGRRVAIPPAAMPINASGVAIDATEWNRNDGFSINSSILTYVDGLDPAASKLPPWTDLAQSLADASPVVIIDVESGERVPLWAEPDGSATSPADQTLVIHPAVALGEDRTYAVALRSLVAAGGKQAEAGPVFRVYRDRLETTNAAVEQRRVEMEDMFNALEAAGIERDTLQLAWTFSTASAQGTTGRMLHIRDEALATIGDAAPTFAVGAITQAPQPGIAFSIEGTYTVPNYLTGDGGPGNRFHYDADVATQSDALPTVNPDTPTLQAPFICNVPDATVAATEPAHLVQYGHGLLGKATEINADNVRTFANSANIVFCATKWAGMSEDDVPNAVSALGDLSLFATLVDRLQQGVLNQVFLGRLMLADGGISSLPELHRADGSQMVDNSRLVFDGNSQGGIMGLMLASVSPDVERVVLGVPGMNYSLLLSRSVDWQTYAAVLAPAYPNELDRRMILSLLQMLWDRGEGGGYVHHVDVPVLMHVAFGDHQVSELAAYVEARTLGVPIQRPVTADGRSREVEPGWGLDTLTYPSEGGGIVVWDSGLDPIPFEDVAPSGPRDSHEDPRADPKAQLQKAAFLFDNTLIDVCAGAPCMAAPVT